jgi:hypothetical protein
LGFGFGLAAGCWTGAVDRFPLLFGAIRVAIVRASSEAGTAIVDAGIDVDMLSAGSSSSQNKSACAWTENRRIEEKHPQNKYFTIMTTIVVFFSNYNLHTYQLHILPRT